MTTVSKQPLLRGIAVLILAIAFLYGCKDFLSAASEPQGTVNQTTLANRAGGGAVARVDLPAAVLPAAIEAPGA